MRRLRSANRGNSNNTWNVNTSGNVNNNNAINALACAPDRFFSETFEVSVSDSFTTSTPTVYVLPVGKGIPPAFVDVDMNSFGVNGFPDDDDQLFVGGNGHIKVEDVPNSGAVILPHRYSSTPQIVGYWTDGRR